MLRVHTSRYLDPEYTLTEEDAKELIENLKNAMSALTDGLIEDYRLGANGSQGGDDESD